MLSKIANFRVLKSLLNVIVNETFITCFWPFKTLFNILIDANFI